MQIFEDLTDVHSRRKSSTIKRYRFTDSSNLNQMATHLEIFYPLSEEEFSQLFSALSAMRRDNMQKHNV